MEGYERLKELYKQGQTKSLTLINIIKFLLTRKGMNDYYLNKEKNLIDMLNYITCKAKKEAINNIAIIEDKDVYEWALEYFSKTNNELGLTSPNNNQMKLEL